MAGNIGDLGDTIKTIYPDFSLEPMLNDQVVIRPLLSSKIPSGAVLSSGYTIKFAAQLKRGQNSAQIGDGKVFPFMKDRLDKQFTLNPTLFTGGFEIGHFTKNVLKTRADAFSGPILQRNIEETIAELAKFLEQSYAAAVAGVRGIVESSTATTITLAKPLGTLLLTENMLISVRQAGAIGTARGTLDGVIISAIDQDTRIITPLTDVGGAPTASNAVANDPIYVVSDGAALTTVTGAIQVLTGVYANSLDVLIDDGTLSDDIHGLSRTTYPKLKAQVSSNGGVKRLLDEFMITAMQTLIRRRSGKRAQGIICGPGMEMAYARYVAPARRFPASPSGKASYETGYEGIKHVSPSGTLSFHCSDDVRPGELKLVNFDTMFRYGAEKPQWITEGGQLHLVPQSGRFKAAYQAMMASIENIGCFRPDAQGVIRDLADETLGDDMTTGA